MLIHDAGFGVHQSGDCLDGTFKHEGGQAFVRLVIHHSHVEVAVQHLFACCGAQAHAGYHSDEVLLRSGAVRAALLAVEIEPALDAVDHHWVEMQTRGAAELDVEESPGVFGAATGVFVESTVGIYSEKVTWHGDFQRTTIAFTLVGVSTAAGFQTALEREAGKRGVERDFVELRAAVRHLEVGDVAEVLHVRYDGDACGGADVYALHQGNLAHERSVQLVVGIVELVVFEREAERTEGLLSGCQRPAAGVEIATVAEFDFLAGIKGRSLAVFLASLLKFFLVL